MSNRDPDRTYQNLSDVLEFCFAREVRGLYTILPGEIVSYANGRARVQPTVRVLLTDGSVMGRPVLSDVPVLHPAGGGYQVHLPLQQGDPVILLFAMRGIGEWKQSMGMSNPGGSVMGLDAALAIPAPARAVTTRDGLVIEGENAFIQIDGSSINLTANEVTVTAPTINLLGTVNNP